MKRFPNLESVVLRLTTVFCAAVFSFSLIFASVVTAEESKDAENEKTEKIYSHIARDNIASVRLHRSCGFEKLLDHAVYVDGSVTHNCCTYLLDA